jgi:hypothetical protein
MKIKFHACSTMAVVAKIFTDKIFSSAGSKNTVIVNFLLMY